MARNISGVLVRQFLGNRKNPCPCAGLLHHRKLLSNSIGTLTLTSPKTIIPSTAKPFSLRSPNLHCLQLRRLAATITRFRFCGAPPGALRIRSVHMYNKILKKVEDERFPAIFFFTDSSSCWKSNRFIDPIFPELCKQYFQYTAIYKVVLRKYGHGGTLRDLKIDHTPTFHFYVNGQMVHELESASARCLKKALEVIYNPPALRKMRAALQAKKEENDRLELEFPDTSFQGVEEAVESGASGGERWWFSRDLFSIRENRKMFCNIEDPDPELKWLSREMDD